MNPALKINKRHIAFIILNILGTILEYFLIFLFLGSTLFRNNILFSFITTVGLFLMTGIFIIFALRKKDKLYEFVEEEVSEEYKVIIDDFKVKFENKTSKPLIIKFVDSGLMNSYMFASKDYVYINTCKNYSYKFLKTVHFEGVLAHELGHAISMSNIYSLQGLRFSTYISNILQPVLIGLINMSKPNKNRLFTRLLIGVLYLFYIMFSYQNYFIVFPFLRKEELEADRLALDFTNGVALRGYYYNILANHTKSKNYRYIHNFIDFKHPDVLVHYQELNKHMKFQGVDNENCELIDYNKIEVKEYKDLVDKNRKIVNFYETYVNKNLIKMYEYIANIYYALLDIENAKKYYKLAMVTNKPSVYKRLRGIAIEQVNKEEFIEYNNWLFEKNGIEARIYKKYYETDFYLSKYTLNNIEFESENDFNKLKLTFDNRIIINRNDNCAIYMCDRKSRNLNVYLENNQIFRYYLRNDNIVSAEYEYLNPVDNKIYVRKDYYTSKGDE